VRALPKDLPDFVEDITPLDMGTNCMLLKCQHQTSKSCTQTTLLSVSEDFRAAMKAAQEAAKAAKAPAKERKIIFFFNIQKASVLQLALFLCS
jgi:large subunit ribosomal protein L25